MKTHHYAWLALPLALGFIGCRPPVVTPLPDLGGNLPDFGTAPLDFAGLDLTGVVFDFTVPSTNDLANAFTPTTIHDIDINNVSDKAKVMVTGVVVVGVTKNDGQTGSNKCEYAARVQDPAGAAPSGLKLYATGMTCTTTNCCPFAPNSGTPLDGLELGDVLTITGNAGVFAPPSDGGLQAAQHSIAVTTVTRTAMGSSVTPVVVTDGVDYGQNGKGYVDHEGMLITVQPAAPFATSTPNSFGEFTGANARFVGHYRFFYNVGLDGGSIPAAGSMWTSITGVATPEFGGGLAARIKTDFVP